MALVVFRDVPEFVEDDVADGDSTEIGFVSGFVPASVSTIVFDEAAGIYVYGPEISADCISLRRNIVREAEGGHRFVEYERFEVRFSPTVGDAVAAGDTVYLASMPIGQRAVTRARVLLPVRSLPDVPVEQLDALPPPLDTEEARRQATDMELFLAVHEMDRNMFETGTTKVAAFPGGEAWEYMTYDDARDPDRIKWQEARANFKEAGVAVGVVSDPEAVRKAVYADKRVLGLFELAGQGKLKVAPFFGAEEKIAIPENVTARSAEHLEIAVRQAMAGAGEDAERRVGQPVATYAADLFERHMLNAAKRLRDRTPAPGQQDDKDVDTILSETEARVLSNLDAQAGTRGGRSGGSERDD